MDHGWIARDGGIVNILHHRSALLGDTVYTRTPIKVLKAIPAGFPLALHDAYFGVAGHSDAIFSNIMTNGEDLRAFTDLAMTSEIPLEIIDITPGSNLIHAYVRVPSALSINDKIYLRTTVGGGETAPAADSTNGSEAVWQDYDCVVHGSDVNADAANNVTSVTTNASTTITGGGLVNGWPAEGYGAREGTGSTNECKLVGMADSDLCSVEWFAFKDNTEDSTTGRMAVEGSSGTLGHQKVTTDDLNMYRSGSTTAQNYRIDAQLVNWFAIQMVWPTFTTQPVLSACRFNGADPTGSPARNAGTGTRTTLTGDYFLMNRSGGATPFDGRLAEFRYRLDNTPDNDWATAFYDGFNNPGALAEAEALVLV